MLPMPLNSFVAMKRQAIFEALLAGQAPAEGDYDETALAEGRAKGRPQMGTTRFKPRQILLEFIFSAPEEPATVLTVAIPAPERIVFLPVPPWVVESIWQGDVDGSYHFETDAERLVQEYRAELSAAANAVWFGPQPPKRRE